jgi:hypothetical protein
LQWERVKMTQTRNKPTGEFTCQTCDGLSLVYMELFGLWNWIRCSDCQGFGTIRKVIPETEIQPHRKFLHPYSHPATNISNNG